MKIARAVISNFRHIEHLELDLTHPLDRVRDVSVIVGPNTSGKTTILDALAAAIGPSTELRYQRPGFHLSPSAIVMSGALFARVECLVRFTPDEIAATRELIDIGEERRRTVPDA